MTDMPGMNFSMMERVPVPPLEDGDTVMDGVDTTLSRDDNTPLHVNTVSSPILNTAGKHYLSEADNKRIRDMNSENQPGAALEANETKLDKEKERLRLKEEALELETENALEGLNVLHVNETPTTPQKERLQARNLKKVETETIMELEKKRRRARANAARKAKRRRRMADELAYEEEAEEAREKAHLDESMRRTVEEMRKMCVEEGQKQNEDVAMDMGNGKTSGSKRGRSESL